MNQICSCVVSVCILGVCAYARVDRVNTEKLNELSYRTTFAKQAGSMAHG